MIDLEREAQGKAREYLRAKGTLQPASVIHARVAAAFTALEQVLDEAPLALVARRTIPGEWTVHEIVDHLVETHRPGIDELRCLLAGRRPPGGPIPAGLQSKAPDLRPWAWLRSELKRVHDDIAETLAAVPPAFETDARAPVVMVINVRRSDGGVEPLHWVEDLDWKAYSIVWRLHVLDHLNQAKKVLAAA